MRFDFNIFGPETARISAAATLGLILLLFGFILLRRLIRSRWFRIRDQRLQVVQRYWEEIVSGKIPAAAWCFNRVDRQLVEEIALDRMELAGEDEARRLERFFVESGLFERHKHDARSRRGWRRRHAVLTMGRMRVPEALPVLVHDTGKGGGGGGAGGASRIGRAGRYRGWRGDHPASGATVAGSAGGARAGADRLLPARSRSADLKLSERGRQLARLFGAGVSGGGSSGDAGRVDRIERGLSAGSAGSGGSDLSRRETSGRGSNAVDAGRGFGVVRAAPRNGGAGELADPSTILYDGRRQVHNRLSAHDRPASRGYGRRLRLTNCSQLSSAGRQHPMSMQIVVPWAGRRGVSA